MRKQTKVLSLKVLIAIVVCIALLATIVTSSALTARADYDGKDYTSTSKNANEAYDKEGALSVKIMQEGITLLKNDNNVLPLTTSATNKTKVSLFGVGSKDPVYGGSGSAGGSGGGATIVGSLTTANYDINPTLQSFYPDKSGRGTVPMGGPGAIAGALTGLATGEKPQTDYTDEVKNSYSIYNEAGIIVFSRVGGEGNDLPRSSVGSTGNGGITGRSNKWDHYLMLDDNEKDLVEAVKASFDKVIILINTATPMELGDLQDDEDIDSIVWVGYGGTAGFEAIGTVLNGTVNPSGRLVDTWARDFKADPVFENLSQVTNASSKYDNYGTAEQVLKDAYKTSGGTEVFNRYYNDAGSQVDYFETAYEEGIYIGYRYWETRGYTESQNGNASWYNDNIVYPFGYGLSYTTFEWDAEFSLTGTDGNAKSKITSGDDIITANVTVKNTGSRAGKDVVELYTSAPYIADGIEKSHVVLNGFEKTGIIQPGESETVKIKIDAKDMASYDYNDSNGNGYSTYELDLGNYTIYAGENSNTWMDTSAEKVTYAIDETLIVGIDTADDELYADFDTTKTTNQFNDVSAYFIDELDKVANSDVQGFGPGTELSRGDWDGTWPTAPTFEELTKTPDEITDQATLLFMKKGSGFWDPITSLEGEEMITTMNEYDEDSPWERTWEDMLKTEEDHSGLYNTGDAYTAENPAPIQLSDMKDAEYGDEAAWAPFLAQMTLKQMGEIIKDAGFRISCSDYQGLGMPHIVGSDGGTGFTAANGEHNTSKLAGGTALTKGNTYACTAILCATWNADLAYEMGEAMGEMGCWIDTQNIYGTGTNLHRSPFSGRNFEYFSEDGVLAGIMAGEWVAGAQSKGVIPFSKHFFLNDTEGNRDSNSLNTWATEQAIREIYLRNAEIMVREYDAMGFMTAFNRVGNTWVGESYPLLTAITRKEWGFKGIFITDARNSWMDNYKMIRGGGDLSLQGNNPTGAFSGPEFNTDDTAEIPTQIYWMRKSVMHTMYALLRTNAMNKIDFYGDNLSASASYTLIKGGTINSGVSVASGMINSQFKDLYPDMEYTFMRDSDEEKLEALGLSLDGKTGSITGQVASDASDSTTLNFIVQLGEDSNGDALYLAGQYATITIATVSASDLDLEYLGQTEASGRSGESFEMYVQAGMLEQVGVSDGVLSYTATGLPSGLSLNASTGIISGTPSSAGRFAVTITATTGTKTVTESVVIYIADYYGSISYGTVSVQSATVGDYYFASVGNATASGGHGVSYSISGGSLPSGLTMSSNGVIYGTPTESGSATVTITASAAGYANKSTQITITVNAASTETSIEDQIAELREAIAKLSNYDDADLKDEIQALEDALSALQSQVKELENKEDEGGCNSTLSGSPVVIISLIGITILAAGALMIFRKKRTDD